MSARQSISSAIGRRFSHFRKSNRLTQTDLATILKTSQGRISAVEVGTLDIDVLWLITLTEKYRLNPMFILGLSKNLYLSEIKPGYKFEDKIPFIEAPIFTGIGSEE